LGQLDGNGILTDGSDVKLWVNTGIQDDSYAYMYIRRTLIMTIQGLQKVVYILCFGFDAQTKQLYCAFEHDWVHLSLMLARKTLAKTVIIPSIPQPSL